MFVTLIHVLLHSVHVFTVVFYVLFIILLMTSGDFIFIYAHVYITEIKK